MPQQILKEVIDMLDWLYAIFFPESGTGTPIRPPA